MGSFIIDSHNIRRVLTPDGFVLNEGGIEVLGLSLNRVQISAVRAEARPAFMCDDVHDRAVTGAKVSDMFSGSKIIYLRDVQKALIRDCRAGGGAMLVREEGPKNRGVEVLPREQQHQKERR